MIHLDMDGVLMDFNRQLRASGLFVWDEVPGNRVYHHLPRDQWQPAELDHDKHISALMGTDAFWRDMPAMADGKLLWKHCAAYLHCVLTARPNNEAAAERVSRHKTASIRNLFDRQFPMTRMNICLRSEKKLLAKPGHVLVDDLPGNCHEWEAAGGTAILHKDALSTIRILEEIGYV